MFPKVSRIHVSHAGHVIYRLASQWFQAELHLIVIWSHLGQLAVGVLCLLPVYSCTSDGWLGDLQYCCRVVDILNITYWYTNIQLVLMSAVTKSATNFQLPMSAKAMKPIVSDFLFSELGLFKYIFHNFLVSIKWRTPRNTIGQWWFCKGHLSLRSRSFKVKMKNSSLNLIVRRLKAQLTCVLGPH